MPDSLARWGQAIRWRGGCQTTFQIRSYSQGKCQRREKFDKFIRYSHLNLIDKIRLSWSKCQIWPRNQSPFGLLANLARIFYEGSLPSEGTGVSSRPLSAVYETCMSKGFSSVAIPITQPEPLGAATPLLTISLPVLVKILNLRFW